MATLAQMAAAATLDEDASQLEVAGLARCPVQLDEGHLEFRMAAHEFALARP
jgi:hypothetical protein